MHRGRHQLLLSPLSPGIHGLSNATLNTPWPKLITARQGVATALRRSWPQDALAALAETTPAADAQLPDTGVGLELERTLSSPFIIGERYGTRATTWLTWQAHSGIIEIGERRFGPGGRELGSRQESIKLALSLC